MMHLYRLATSILVHDAGQWYRLSEDWDTLVNRDDLLDWLRQQIASATPLTGTPDLSGLQPPIGSQEVWAAGVTDYRSRTARMEESKSAGGGDFYDRVYEAERPELFFKATPHRVRGHKQAVRLRGDARWNVPEPELTLMVTSAGTIVGYTIGNDMSSRDIEGENPLYLPQAKVYDGSCALGPGLLFTDTPLPPTTTIRLTIRRCGAAVLLLAGRLRGALGASCMGGSGACSGSGATGTSAPAGASSPMRSITRSRRGVRQRQAMTPYRSCRSARANSRSRSQASASV